MKLEVKGRGGVELLVEVFVLTVDRMFELGVGRRKAWMRRLCRPENMSLSLSKPDRREVPMSMRSKMAVEG